MSDITITFPDGSEQSHPVGVTPLEIAKGISEGLARQALAAEFDKALIDLDRKLVHNGTLRILTLKDEKGVEVLRHSCAHVLAQAVKRLYPKALPTIGPVIEHGFYYDFDDLDISEEDLQKIEEEMQRIVKEDFPAKRHDYDSVEEAKKDFQDNSFKIELIEEHMQEGLSRYDQGEFSDLCRGPHVPSTGVIKAFKLTRISMAYWRGDSDNKQLTRIYGLCFPKKSELEAHQKLMEEAEKRDHRKLGRELGLLMFHEHSPGSPFFLPKGAIIVQQLTDFIRSEYKRRGYREVITPLLYSKELWQKSGHWDHYRDNMFLLKVEGRDFSLKPMNCPSHCLIYLNEAKSYRDLPLRIADFAPLHRNELSGTLSGLTRVRKFQQDDAHIFCAIEQLKDEIKDVMDFVNYVYKDVFSMEYHLELSTRPEKYMGEVSQWDFAEAALTECLDELRLDYKINPGDGAFYGPKIDVHIKDAIGRSHQLATVQVDFQLPLRFGLAYEGSDGEKHTPVMVHRAVLGSIERFFALALEHFAGKFPLWLSPEQVRILPIADRHVEHCNSVKGELLSSGMRVTVDDRSLTTNKKVREAELDRVNYILVVGDTEVKNNTVNVRTRDNKILGERSVADLLEKLFDEISSRTISG